ncbi:M3 family oligoendopeptidase [bacterium]|nr:M3 family oligoendopeptidase [bacterium]
MKDKEFQWSLDDLLKKKDFQAKFDELLKMIKKGQRDFDKLSPDMPEKQFKTFINSIQKILTVYYHFSGFVGLYSSTHVGSKESTFYGAKNNDIALAFSELSLNIKHWLIGKKIGNKKVLDKKNQKRLFQSMPELKFYFELLEETAKHSLSLAEERIISRKSTILKSPLVILYGLITNDFEYEIKMKTGKTKKIKTQGELLGYIRNKDKNIRKAAYKALFEPYKKNLTKVFTIYSALVKDWDDNTKLSNFQSPISKRNFGNNIQDKTVETVMNVCTDKRTIFQDYFKLKANVMGVKKLSRYDLYSPIGKAKGKTYTFAEAKKEVLKNFKEFTPKFEEAAKMILNNNHVDSHPRENKRSGAFCASHGGNSIPFVLLNFNGNADALMTMAHELGHGIHGIYSWKNPVLVIDPPLPLAETASTFSEMLMFDRLLKKAKSKEEKITMLFEKLDSSFATILRQNYFVKFEIKAHELISKGTDAEKLSDLYMEILKEQFGNSMNIPEEFKYEWSYIPHIFHTPFYCYAYNFGELLSMSLFALYVEKGRSFIPKIEKVLKAGGSERPEKLLESIGIDITSKKFWEGSFTLIENWLELLNNLL